MFDPWSPDHVYLMLFCAAGLVREDFTTLMRFPRKGDIGNYWKTGKQERRNPALRQRKSLIYPRMSSSMT